MVTNMAGQGQGKAGQGDQGKHPPTRPAGGSQQLSGWQGQGGQGSRYRGPREVPFLLKISLGKTGDLHLIKQKYKFKKKLFSL
jgi:hypothetical protein